MHLRSALLVSWFLCDVLVLLNFGEEAVSVTAADAASEATFARFAQARDLLSGEQKQMPLQLPAKNAVVLALLH